MAKKNPAFNFYSSDFLTETTFMTNEQVGAYIRLLCYQHQFEYLTKDQILTVTKDPIVLEKFREKNGKFFNQTLKEIIDKKKEHCAKQRANVLKRWRKNNNTTAIPSYKNGIAVGNDMEIPLENVIVIENNKEDIFTFVESNYSRTISSYEYQLIEKWLQNFNEDVVKRAFEISIANDKKTFSYVEGILNNWKSAQIKTIKDLESNSKEASKIPEWFDQKNETTPISKEDQEELERIIEEFK